MSRLAEGLARFFGRVEILARGAEELRRQAEEALRRGRVLEARRAARALLQRVPDSPVGLALWADAAEAARLDDEVIRALQQLVEQVPWRQDVWLRLGLAGLRSGWQGARDALERAATFPGDPAVARHARLELCDWDLAAGDPQRALRWLDRIGPRREGVDTEAALRTAECLWAAGDVTGARRAAEQLAELGRADGRDRLLRARLLSWGEPPGGSQAESIELALAATILDARGAAGQLTVLVAGARSGSDAATDAALGRVRRVLDGLGLVEQPEWRAAFALAEGRRGEARSALLRLLGRGDAEAVPALLALAGESRDLEALRAVAERDPSWLSHGHHQLLEGARIGQEGREHEALDLLETASGTEAAEWARQLAEQIVQRWVPAPADGGQAAWTRVLGELRSAARTLDRLDWIESIEQLAVERERPLRVALLGEFNAGKSTLLNALLGTDVAPTGVRPTTASLHWVAWATDPFARIELHGERDRVVPHGDLKGTLDELRDASLQVRRVYIYAPIERLKRVELLDTPGFNAPAADHAEVAAMGIEEAHLALWLLDATGPLRDTERQVLQRIAAADVPIQILVNKRDRVDDGQLSEVMAYVEDALGQAGITSYRPAVALSARDALQGRLGDAEALARSGWPAVEQLLAADIVDRRDALRERALRRKSAQIAAELAELAKAQAARHREQLGVHQRREQRLRVVAAGLEANRRELSGELARTLQPALRELEADARPVEQLQNLRQRDDADVQDYLTDRAVARLAPALLEGLDEVVTRFGEAECADDWDGVRAALRFPVYASLRAGAAAYRSGAVLGGPALRATVDAALWACAAALRATSGPAPIPPAASALRWRLASLAQALAGGAGPQGDEPA